MRTSRISLYLVSFVALMLETSALAQDNAATPAPAPTLRGFQLDPNRDTRRTEPEAQGPEINERVPQPVRPEANPAPVRVTPTPEATCTDATDAADTTSRVAPQPDINASSNTGTSACTRDFRQSVC